VTPGATPVTTFREVVVQRNATKRFDGRAVFEETDREILELVRFPLNHQPQP
jgi:hypothetical protein